MVDKVVDMNDSYTKAMNLSEQHERDALLNEAEADRLEAEADRLRDVAKEKRAKSKEQKTFAEDLTSKKKTKAKEEAQEKAQDEANEREHAALADDPRSAPAPIVKGGK